MMIFFSSLLLSILNVVLFVFRVYYEGKYLKYTDLVDENESIFNNFGWIKLVVIIFCLLIH